MSSKVDDSAGSVPSVARIDLDEHIDITELPREPTPRVADRTRISVHRHVLRTLEAAQRSLLSFATLPPLIQYLLKDLPELFATAGAELRLLDPESHCASLLPARHRAREELSLLRDSYALYELFEDSPRVTLMALEDPRMFRVLRAAPTALGAVIMPLWDGNRLLGTYHLALVEGMEDYAGEDVRLFNLLAQVVGSSILRVQASQRSEQLALLDPITELGNPRSFARDVAREIARAGRELAPLTLQLLSVDDLDEIRRIRGEVEVNLVMRCLADRLGAMLRSTDTVARTATSQLAVLLPGCSEPQAHDIAERLRHEFEQEAIDDGRGAVIEVALSAGLVCWDPRAYRLDSSERLAEQMMSSAGAALAKVVRAGGNGVAVSRLGLLMV
ncbi:MAG: GGDEF domain-containing protein [Halieaceae bacterium]|nr:GGDEF domain-containing protein [Halieaceae bacterium]